MRTFLQIGDKAVNVYQITEVWFTPNVVYVDLAILDGDSAAQVTFHGGDADAFREWWEREADVYRAL